MKFVFFLIFLGIIYEHSRNVLTEKLHTLLRIKKVEVDPLTYTNVFPVHYIINQYNYEQFVTGYFRVIADVELFMFQLKVDRCDLDAVNCRHFNTFNITQLNSFMNDKNRPWSNVTYAIHPRIRLPNPKQGWYTVSNATSNPEILTFMIPDSTKYYWKIAGRVFDKNNVVLGKIDLHYTILQFIERRRSKFN